jgi:hypothetical protein
MEGKILNGASKKHGKLKIYQSTLKSKKYSFI